MWSKWANSEILKFECTYYIRVSPNAELGIYTGVLGLL